MKLQQLIQQVYYEPALITPEAHHSIRQLLENRFGQAEPAESGAGIRPLVREPGKDYCGAEVEVEQMEIINGVAHIPIGGAIGQDLSPFDRGEGCVDVLDVMDELAQAEENPRVRGILLDIDSPGGMVMGTPELADRIAAVDKPVMAFTRGLMASAAYWVASAADGIFSTRSASVGSIGVYLPVVDLSKRFEGFGVKVELIKAGKFKGTGYPGTSLTEETREELQSRVNSIYEMFKGQVRGARGSIPDEIMQGQVFMGEEAFVYGLVDAIVRSKEEVCSLI
jgi:signal peptide peptidase SppA